MTGAVFALTTALLASLTVSAAPRTPQAVGAVFAEIDAVAVDGDGRTVEGLRQDEFELKEDGRRVSILTFEEVSAAAVERGGARGRSVVLVLDDIAVHPSGTLVMRSIAQRFLSRATSTDRVGVLRLSHRGDEPFGSLEDALLRIDEYVAGSQPYFGRETLENWLKLVAKVSRQFEEPEGRRKVIVTIGVPGVFDIIEPPDRAKSLLWPSWVDAVSAAARANVAIYVIDPSGITSSRRLPAEGLVEKTGGLAFSTNDFQRATDRIWREAGHYYVLGYIPAKPGQTLHSIQVEVSRRGVRARARRARGE